MYNSINNNKMYTASKIWPNLTMNNFSINLTHIQDYGDHEEYTLFQDQLSSSNNNLEQITKINLLITFIVIVFGLIGNYLIIFVFAQKNNRKNSSHIFLLCLAINDSLFLKIHIFENVLRTYLSLYGTDDGNLFYSVIKYLNVTDRFALVCSFVNYSRYVLRFISAYIIVSYTIQRVIIVSLPLKTRVRTKSCAWLNVLLITFISILLNAWILFLFELKDKIYCSIKKEWEKEYLQITVVYVIIIMLIPITIIFVCNLITIVRTKKSDTNRNVKLHVRRSDVSKIEMSKSKQISSLKMKNNEDLKSFIKSNNMKPFYRLKEKTKERINNAKKVAKILMLISFSYVIFNLPYLIIWLIYYYMNKIKSTNPILTNYLFSLTRIAETLQILNYSIHLYVYCLSGESFRNQLNESLGKYF